MKKIFISLAALSAVILSGCGGNKQKEETNKTEMQQLVESYAPVKLTTDLSVLSEKEQAMLPIFIKIAEIMDGLFWEQSFGDKSVLDTISDEYVREFAMIQYGAWNRLDCEKPFVPGYGEKPKGANFYPVDMTKEEFVEAIQARQGYYVSCIEEIAWRRGFINSDELRKIGNELKMTDYGKYILSLLEEDIK